MSLARRELELTVDKMIMRTVEGIIESGQKNCVDDDSGTAWLKGLVTGMLTVSADPAAADPVKKFLQEVSEDSLLAMEVHAQQIAAALAEMDKVKQRTLEQFDRAMEELDDAR